jgi:3-hydroxyacyl-CoA dehydrogenase
VSADLPVARRRHGRVLVLEIDNPPVNAGSAAVRQGLLAGVREAATDDDIDAVVIIGAAGRFISGSDLKEFGGAVAEPLLPAVLTEIERCPKVIVAALDGAALGGGLELAMACDHRVATPRCLLGLPEINFGMVPGSGGTQRLPRLAGPAAAISLITSGRRIDATKGLAMGIVDELAEPDELFHRALAAASRIDGKHRVIQRAVPDLDGLQPAEEAALRKAAGRDDIREAVRLVRMAAEAPVDVALAEERRTFDRLRARPEAAALRHVFFAERRAGKVPGPDGVAPRTVCATGVVGGGTMGVGIAAALLIAGYRVVLAERDQDALDAGLIRVREFLREAHKKGKLPDLAGADKNLQGTADLADLAGVDLVVEAVYEDLEVKTDVLLALDRVLAPDAVIATNTSYLDVNELARRTTRPERILGLHFFNPAHVMKLVEVVPAGTTDPQVLLTTLRVVKAMGKQAVVAGASEGFIGNRIFAAYRRQCEFLLEEGALPEQVDRALTEFGMAMGPFAVADLSGLDIAAAMRRRCAMTADPRKRYVGIPDLLVEAGRLGRKTGAGYYAYGDGGPVPDEEVTALIARYRAERGLPARGFSAEEIVERTIWTMVNQAALVLADGVAQRPGDIDVALVLGYGFPRRRGGPLWWAAGRGPDEVARALDTLEEVTGYGFRRGPVEEVLDQVRGGQTTRSSI